MAQPDDTDTANKIMAFVRTSPSMTEQFTIRMLGDNLTLTRYQWLELHDLISSITDEGQEQRARIRARLDVEDV
jgi:hypothetical protein